MIHIHQIGVFWDFWSYTFSFTSFIETLAYCSGTMRTKLMKLTFTLFSPSLLFANQRMVQAQLHHHHADGSSHSAQHVEGHNWAQRQKKQQHPQHVMKEKLLVQPQYLLFCFGLFFFFSLSLSCSHDFPRIGKPLLLLQLLMCADWITWLIQHRQYAVCWVSHGDRENNPITQLYVSEGKSLHSCVNSEWFNALDMSNRLVLLFNLSIHCAMLSLHLVVTCVLSFFSPDTQTCLFFFNAFFECVFCDVIMYFMNWRNKVWKR